MGAQAFTRDGRGVRQRRGRPARRVAGARDRRPRADPRRAADRPRRPARRTHRSRTVRSRRSATGGAVRARRRFAATADAHLLLHATGDRTIEPDTMIVIDAADDARAGRQRPRPARRQRRDRLHDAAVVDDRDRPARSVSPSAAPAADRRRPSAAATTGTPATRSATRSAQGLGNDMLGIAGSFLGFSDEFMGEQRARADRGEPRSSGASRPTQAYRELRMEHLRDGRSLTTRNASRTLPTRRERITLSDVELRQIEQQVDEEVGRAAWQLLDRAASEALAAAQRRAATPGRAPASDVAGPELRHRVPPLFDNPTPTSCRRGRLLTTLPPPRSARRADRGETAPAHPAVDAGRTLRRGDARPHRPPRRAPCRSTSPAPTTEPGPRRRTRPRHGRQPTGRPAPAHDPGSAPRRSPRPSRAGARTRRWAAAFVRWASALAGDDRHERDRIFGPISSRFDEHVRRRRVSTSSSEPGVGARRRRPRHPGDDADAIAPRHRAAVSEPDGARARSRPTPAHDDHRAATGTARRRHAARPARPTRPSTSIVDDPYALDELALSSVSQHPQPAAAGTADRP